MRGAMVSGGDYRISKPVLLNKLKIIKPCSGR